MVPPVARIVTLGSACCAWAMALAVSRAAPAAKARNRGERYTMKLLGLFTLSGGAQRYKQGLRLAMARDAKAAWGHARAHAPGRPSFGGRAPPCAAARSAWPARPG